MDSGALRAEEPLLRRQHTLEVDEESGRCPETQGLILLLRLIVPLDTSSASLLDLRFLALGDPCSYPGFVKNCLVLTGNSSEPPFLDL